MAVKWKQSLLQSLEHNSQVPFSKFFQIATVKPDGRPANRTVVYRGFEGESEKVLFTTDTRTRKVEDFQKQPWGEICWYFTETREQYRLGGNLSLIDKDADGEAQQTRKENWGTMSKSLRAWFNGPPPGEPRTENEEEFSKPPPDTSDPPVPSFALVICDVEEVDYVDLRSNERQLFKKKAGQWSDEALNP